MKRFLVTIGICLLGCCGLQAQYSYTRNSSNNVYRNDYFRLGGSSQFSFEVHGGRLYATGNGGVLGIGTFQIQDSWLQSGNDSNLLNISVSVNSHTMAIHSDGTLWATGLNDNGELGIGTTQNHLDWVQVGSDHNWLRAAACGEFSLAIKANGSLWG